MNDYELSYAQMDGSWQTDDYIVVYSRRDSSCNLARYVNALMARGFAPLGGVAVSQTYIFQAMTRTKQQTSSDD